LIAQLLQRSPICHVYSFCLNEEIVMQELNSAEVQEVSGGSSNAVAVAFIVNTLAILQRLIAMAQR
jgi:hypothetical protein